ncbi:catalase family peroxidase [Oxalobacteraceae bacterium OM1]|nr:catalase family peroxidase [Oxalobacteraceae bacterium OM1]
MDATPHTPPVVQVSTAAPSATLPAEIVAALKTNAGNPPGVRASFAKGQCVTGTYTPSDKAATVTRSRSFTHPSKVLGRFSVGGGSPKVADSNRTVLRGFSLRIGQGPDVSNVLFENAPVHFAKSQAQMLAFLEARTPGPDGKPDPAKVKAFSDANPETLNQAHYVAAHPVPGSFAGITYFAVHAFPATNAKGAHRFVKLQIVPIDGPVTLSDEDAKHKPDDFLFQDLNERLAHGGLRFKIVAILDRAGDPVMDVTTRWPDEDSRESVTLGTVHIQAQSDNAPCDATIFNPATLADGIGAPPDEIFAARSTAYAVSLARRQSENAKR